MIKLPALPRCPPPDQYQCHRGWLGFCTNCKPCKPGNYTFDTYHLHRWTECKIEKVVVGDIGIKVWISGSVRFFSHLCHLLGGGREDYEVRVSPRMWPFVLKCHFFNANQNHVLDSFNHIEQLLLKSPHWPRFSLTWPCWAITDSPDETLALPTTDSRVFLKPPEKSSSQTKSQIDHCQKKFPSFSSASSHRCLFVVLSRRYASLKSWSSWSLVSDV